MVISIINPEGIAVFAFGQLVEARKLKRQWEKYVMDMSEEKKWTQDEVKEKKDSFCMDVAFFIVMGGFTIDSSTVKSDRHVDSKHIKRLKKHGILPKRKEGVGERTNSIFTATLTPHGFETYARQGYFDDCGFNKHEIRDKGKASNIAKILSAAQALWLGVQCAARKADKLPLRYFKRDPMRELF